MNTSYDILWATFLQNCEVESIELPQTPEGIYKAIHNAILFFNNRMHDNLKADDSTETLDRELSDSYLLLLAQYIKLVFLKNKLLYRTALIQPFQKEIGLKNYQSQLNHFSEQVKEQERLIEDIILFQNEDFMS